MAIMTASAGEEPVAQGSNAASKEVLYESSNGRWKRMTTAATIPSTASAARFLRPFSFATKQLRTVFQQLVRGIFVNLSTVSS